MTTFSKGYWLNEDARTVLSRGYLQEGETPEGRIQQIADTAGFRLYQDPAKALEYIDKFEDYMLRGFYSLASPIWANYGLERGLPISCNGTYFDDSVADILEGVAEIGMMTKMGAGTSAYLSPLRPRGTPVSSGGTSDGPVHFASLLETTVNVISQGNVRRGACAVYLDVEHPDIMEFLEMREEGNSIQKLSMGVVISDDWMNDMIAGSEYKRKVWTRIVRKRCETGYPYLVFRDTVQRGAPEVYRNAYYINSSNLCSEIALPSSFSESFVCCLSSMNLLHYDEWKNTDAVEVLVYFLDTVISEYIEKARGIPHLQRAVKFAGAHRAIGVGVLGWHSYLQSHSISFIGMQAKFLNAEIHREIHNRAYKASAELAEMFGAPPAFQNSSAFRRNTTLLAIAPTTSSSFILGQVSPSIEPLASNYFIKDLSKGKFTYRNPYLKETLKDYGQDTEDVWLSILMKGGSVQHLDWMSEEDKEIFLTFGEIPQAEIIIQAAQRQQYIDQSQSLNLMIHPQSHPKDVSQLLIKAWELGVKTLYYQRSTNPAQELMRNLLDCSACEA